MVLHEEVFVVLPEDTKSLVAKQVEIPEGVEKIEILLSYTPEHEPGASAEAQVRDAMGNFLLETQPSAWLPEEAITQWQQYSETLIGVFVPLRNQLTMGIYAPDGQYWGRWDARKFFDRPVELGLKSASGLKQGRLTSGKWTLEIENFGIFSERLEVSLKVTGYAAPTERRWFRGETHSHSQHSDGDLLTQDLVREAASIGLDFLVLSDHNTIVGWDDVTGREPLLVIKGEELTTFFGHAVAAGYPEYLDWRSPSAEAAPNQQASAVRKAAGLFTIAHPFMIGEPLCCGCRWQYTNMDMSLVDAVEIWSGSWRKKAIFNSRALQWWDELLLAGHHITGVAARDIHKSSELHDLDAADTVVAATSLEPCAILDGIRQGRVSVGPKGRIDFSAQKVGDSQGKSAFMGQSLPGTCDSWELDIEIVGLPEAGLLQLVSDGETTQEREVKAGSAKVSWMMPAPDVYLRLQVWTEDRRRPLLFSNPIYRL